MKILSCLFLSVLFVTPICMSDSPDFLPVPGEMTATPTVKPVLLPDPVVKTNSRPVPPPAVVEPPKRPNTTSASLPTSDWSTYTRARVNKVVFEGKLVDKASLTPLVGFLVKEHDSFSNGTQTFSGATVDIATRKDDNDKVATAMELRPALWRHTGERVFLLNYKPATLPGALLRIYVQEVDALEGWRTFKTGNEPSFEDWKRLGGR